MPDAEYALPYEGAGKMLLVDHADDQKYLTGLFRAMFDELPAPKSKKKYNRNETASISRIFRI